MWKIYMKKYVGNMEEYVENMKKYKEICAKYEGKTPYYIDSGTWKNSERSLDARFERPET